MVSESNRDSKGRFAKGNRGGPGRPTRSVEIARELGYFGIVVEEVTEHDWRLVVRRAIDDAKKGDNAARNWLSQHLVADSLDQILDWRKSHEFWEGISSASSKK